MFQEAPKIAMSCAFQVFRQGVAEPELRPKVLQDRSTPILNPKPASFKPRSIEPLSRSPTIEVLNNQMEVLGFLNIVIV